MITSPRARHCFSKLSSVRLENLPKGFLEFEYCCKAKSPQVHWCSAASPCIEQYLTYLRVWLDTPCERLTVGTSPLLTTLLSGLQISLNRRVRPFRPKMRLAAASAESRRKHTRCTTSSPTLDRQQQRSASYSTPLECKRNKAL